MLNIWFLLAQVVLLCSCYEITPVGRWKTKIGDSPHYDAETNSLYYTDAVGEYQLLRYDLSEDKIYEAKIEGTIGRVGFVLPIEGRHDKFLVGMKQHLQVIKWDGKSDTAKIYCTQLLNDKDAPTNFIHDGKVDSHGRLYFGTLRYDMCNPNVTLPPGSLFLSDDGNTIQSLIPGLLITNDLAIDENRNILYLVDTCKQVIRAFDWDPLTAAVSNDRVVFDFRTELLKEFALQIPDSVKLDIDGKVWVSCNGGSSVVRFDPDTGKVLQKITLPERYIESLAFGGEDMDTLFVTTNSVQIVSRTGEITKAQLPPYYGTLYKITGLGFQGVPPKKLSKKFATCAPEKSFKHFFHRN